MFETLKKLFGGSREAGKGRAGDAPGDTAPSGREVSPEHFPFVIGRIALDKEGQWSIDLPLAFKLRHEDGQMVLWREGFTIFLTVWNTDNGEAKEDRLAYFKLAASSGAFDRNEEGDGTFLRYSYRLEEPSDDARVAAFYGYVFAAGGHVQLSMYFDQEGDVACAEGLLRSISDAPPTLEDPTVLSQLCIATNAVMEEGAELGIMYRDEPVSPQASGWQFFTGRESQAYADDLDNVQAYPVAIVAERHPEALPHLGAAPGSEFMRNGDRLQRS